MTGWTGLIIGLLAGGLGGYILKDQTTDEYVSNLKINKIRSKGTGSGIVLDVDQEMEIQHKKLTWKERRSQRKARRQEKKQGRGRNK